MTRDHPLSLSEIICLEGFLNTRPAHKQPWTRYYCRMSGPVIELYESDDCAMLRKEVEITLNTRVVPDSKMSCNFFHLEESGEYVIGFAAIGQFEARRWMEAIKALAVPMPSLTIDDFTLLSVIGRGYFGKVMLVRKKGTDEYYALKSVRKTKLAESGKMASIVAERNIMMMIRNPFIVKLCFAFQTEKKFYLGQEYAPGGDLYFYMQHHGLVHIDDARLYVAEIAIAMEHLHELGVVYRDLKPENVLFGRQGHVKLTDFGLAKNILESSTNTFCGTMDYMAPEMVKSQPYSFAVDWWALGVVLCEMVTGKLPFCGDGTSNCKKLCDAICNSEPVIGECADEDARDMIRMLLTKDEEKRPGFAEIQRHPFLSCLKWDYVVNKRYQPHFVPECAMDDPIYFDPSYTREAAVDSSDDDEQYMKVEGFSFNMPPTLAETRF